MISQHLNVKYIFINIQRSEKNWNLPLMEALKDGYVFSAKYESCMLRLKPLHLVVLCNRLPDQEALSEDRYSYQETYTGMSLDA
eukprot:4286827-Pleurochrysis_carterae.AAC.1